MAEKWVSFIIRHATLGKEKGKREGCVVYVILKAYLLSKKALWISKFIPELCLLRKNLYAEQSLANLWKLSSLLPKKQNILLTINMLHFQINSQGLILLIIIIVRPWYLPTWTNSIGNTFEFNLIYLIYIITYYLWIVMGVIAIWPKWVECMKIKCFLIEKRKRVCQGISEKKEN